jgi:hypothetical protein
MAKNDVYTYTPEDRHCLEGLAIENERGTIVDWFWRGEVVWNQVVRRDAADLTKIANLDDYELVPSNREYAREDRLTITAQHGHQRTYYIRKGAKPDLATRIENARAALREAMSEADYARRRADRAQEDLERLLAEES